MADIKRAKDTPEGSFVKVLDEVPDSELTIGDTGIVQDSPEGKLLITEEIDIPLPLSPSTPLEIISPVKAARAVGPAFEEEFETEFGTADEVKEMAELFDMPEEDMTPEQRTRLQRLGERARGFGRGALEFGRGALELSKAVGATVSEGIGELAEQQELEERRARRRASEGRRQEFEEEALTRAGEFGLRVGELGLKGVGRVAGAAGRGLRRAVGAQLRLEQVPGFTTVRFEQDDPENNVFRGDVGVVQFGARTGRRKVLIPSTGETLFPSRFTQVTILGASDQPTRRAREFDRVPREFDRVPSRFPIASSLREDQLESFFIQPSRPRDVSRAPETFRPRIAPARVAAARPFRTPFTPQEGQPLEQPGFAGLAPIGLESTAPQFKIFPEIKIFEGQRIIDF